MFFLRVPWLRAIINWLSALFGRRAPESRARMIEYHVPENYQSPHPLWLPAESRGKLIEFSSRGTRKSA